MEQIENYLNEYEELWHEISKYDSLYPCGDVAMNIINEKDYYGFNFSKHRKVYEIFFAGSNNFFPAICNVINEKIIDQYPIYIFDLASDNNSSYVGNFKYFITELLKDHISKSKSKKYIKIAKEALCDANVFSNNVITKKYVLCLNN